MPPPFPNRAYTQEQCLHTVCVVLLTQRSSCLTYVSAHSSFQCSSSLLCRYVLLCKVTILCALLCSVSSALLYPVPFSVLCSFYVCLSALLARCSKAVCSVCLALLTAQCYLSLIICFTVELILCSTSLASFSVLACPAHCSFSICLSAPLAH